MSRRPRPARHSTPSGQHGYPAQGAQRRRGRRRHRRNWLEPEPDCLRHLRASRQGRHTEHREPQPRRGSKECARLAHHTVFVGSLATAWISWWPSSMGRNRGLGQADRRRGQPALRVCDHRRQRRRDHRWQVRRHAEFRAGALLHLPPVPGSSTLPNCTKRWYRLRRGRPHSGQRLGHGWSFRRQRRYGRMATTTSCSRAASRAPSTSATTPTVSTSASPTSV